SACAQDTTTGMTAPYAATHIDNAAQTPAQEVLGRRDDHRHLALDVSRRVHASAAAVPLVEIGLVVLFQMRSQSYRVAVFKGPVRRATLQRSNREEAISASAGTL